MLITPLKSRTILLEKDHRGFIKYIFSHSDSYYPRIKWIRRIKAWWYQRDPSAYAAEKMKNQKLTYDYIDELAKQLESKGLCSHSIAQKLATLIKETTSFDPTARPSSQTVYETIQKIERQHSEEVEISKSAQLEEETPNESLFSRYIVRPFTTIHEIFSLMRGEEIA